MASFLLDTNHMGVLLDNQSDLRRRVFEGLDAGIRFGTCIPVLCELQAGLRQTARREANQRILNKILRRVRIWPLDLPLAVLYAEIYLDLRARGRRLSQVDVILAALAQSMNATLLTSDRDFEAVSGLRIENWIA